MRVQLITAQFVGMRKPQEFIVYPYKLGQNTLFIQSDKSVGCFDIVTGKGVLNYKCKGHNGFFQLNEALGAIEFQYPSEFVFKCMELQPKSGDKIGNACCEVV